MNKALTIALLFAAAALVSANDSVTINVPNPHQTVNSVKDSIQDLHQQLAAAQGIANGDLKDCKCSKECEDKKQEYCKVTTEIVNTCEEVEVQKDYIECKTKCFTADHVIEINVPTVDLNNKGRRLFEVEPVKKDGQIVIPAHPLDGILGGAAGGAAGGKGDGKGDGKGKEVCREICSPGQRPVKETQCDDVPNKKYDCKDQVIYTSCKQVCKCGNNLVVEFKESPDLVALGAAAAQGTHPVLGAKAAVGAAVVKALP